MQRLFVIMLCLFVAACGSGGGSSSTNAETSNAQKSKYIGSYIGTWSTDNQEGIAEINIDQYGKITGALRNKTTSSIATITSGSVDDTGALSFSYKYPSDSYIGTVTASSTVSGNTITISGKNNIGNSNLNVYSQLLNKDAKVDVTNNNNYWRGYYNYNEVKIILSQSGSNINGTYSGSGYTGTISGTISGSIINLTFTPSLSNQSIQQYQGLVSTGFYYPYLPTITSRATPGGQCFLTYDTQLSSGNFIASQYILKSN